MKEHFAVMLHTYSSLFFVGTTYGHLLEKKSLALSYI